ncbi:S8 family serine peptidase [Streptomyces lavendulocolor]|uniref:S8 family serine peptidase n=1 Tax=Streptomyces lavendulocolor TaxID=67316 RepID=UPI003C302685
MEIRSVLRDVAVPQEDLLGTPEVCVAVLDGPVDLTHPCFQGADVTQIDTLVREPAGQGPMSLHGTHVASLLFGQQNSPVTGMVPRCRGLSLPVFRDLSPDRVPQVDLARAIERAVQEGAHVINISGGERTADGQADHLLAHTLQRCEELGVLVVSAVGNDGCDCLEVPAAVPSVLSVGATSAAGAPLEFNNWGAVYRRNGVLAPGEDIDGAVPGGGHQLMTGSSFATPAVSGVAGLLVSAQVRSGREANPKDVGRLILQTATPPACLPDETAECRRYLGGHLNAALAHQSIAAHHTPTAREEAAQRDQTPLSAPQQLPQLATAGVQPSQGATHVTTSQKATSMETTGPPAAPSQELGAPAEIASPSPQQGSIPSDGLRPSCTCDGCAGNTTPHGAAPSANNEQPQLEQHDDAAIVDELRQASFHAAAAPPGRGTTSGAVPAAPTVAAEPPVPTGGVRPACSATQYGPRPLVYVIGTINYDFGTEARRDSFRQEMPDVEVPGPDGPNVYPANVYDPGQMRDYLSAAPWECSKLHFTLEIDKMPAYVLEAEPAVGMEWGGPVPPTPDESDATYRQPRMPGAPPEPPPSLSDHWYPPVSHVYKVLRDAVWGQSRPRQEIEEYVSRVSIPGVLTDRTARLFNGMTLPVLEVQSRGIATWNEAKLVHTVTDNVLKDAKKRDVRIDKLNLEKTIRALFDKLYNQFRNLGQTSADRALNYAGTNAYQFGSDIMQGLLSAKHVPGPEDRLYTLDRITVSKSPFSRPNSDCQDVYISFIDPENDQRARVTYVYTIDVSDLPGVSLVPTRTFLGEM